MNCKCQWGTKMTITLSDIKKLCKEKGISFRAASLFGVSKNDSGRCDFYIETADKFYAVKFITLGSGARYVHLNNVGGGYVSVKGENATDDFVWVEPDFNAKKSEKPTEKVLLLDSDVHVTLKEKNSATTVTSGASAFGCKVYCPSAFVKLF